jgi:stage II sporulation protein AA (anti-sigma F factor antagonist)
MKVLSSYRDGRLCLALKGELDHHEARQAMESIDRMIDEYLPRDCVIDMSGLSFMDSSGIAVILRTAKRLNQMGGRAWVENPASQPRRVIDASGIDRLVKITVSGGAR